MSIQPISSSDNAEKSTQSTAAVKTAEILKDFQNLLLLTTLSSMGLGESSSSSSNLFGSNSDSLSGLFSSSGTDMSSLLEQLLAMQVQSGAQTDSSTSELMSYSAGVGKAAVQINQFDGEKQVGGDGINSNCGPTSLVMALHRLGLKVAEETSDTSNGKAIDLARKSMAANSAVDGVDARGKRVESEHNAFTDFEDLARGAAAAGAQTKMINPSSNGIKNAINVGASVIISGTFLGKSSLPWTGDRGSDNKSAPGNAGNHIVLVSGYNSSTGTFTINDPARITSKQVSASALEKFMEGNAGAIAIYK